MCQAIEDGGRRCPQHRHASIGMMKAVGELHPNLNHHQITRMFSELRREGRDSNIPQEVFSVIRANFIASNPGLSDGVREEVERQFALSETHDTEIDSGTIYAISTLSRRVKEREESLNSFFVDVSEKTSLTVDEVKDKFWEEYKSVDTSRGSEPPAEYDQNTRRRAVLANLPYDRASVAAIERLKNLSEAPTKEKVRRVELIEPAVPSRAISKFGWHNGRLEVVFHSNPERIYAYRNVTEEQWADLKNSSSPGRAWRFVRSNPELHAYESQEESESDGYAMKCVSCGQFRSATGHVCPQTETREVLRSAGLSTDEINTELESSHPEDTTIADDDGTDRPVSAEEEAQLEELRRRLTEEDGEEEPAPAPTMDEEALAALRRILSGEDEQEEETSEPEPAPAPRTRTRATARVTPESVALEELPDLREDPAGKLKANEESFSYDHEAFLSLDSLAEQTEQPDPQDPIYNALIGRNENFKPLEQKAEDGKHLILVQHNYELTRVTFENQADSDTVHDFLNKVSSHYEDSRYGTSKAAVILEVESNEGNTYSNSAKATRIVSMFLKSQVNTTAKSLAGVRGYSIISRNLSFSLTPNIKKYDVSARTAEDEISYTETFNSEVESLMDDGKVVRVDGGSTVRISDLNYDRGFTNKDGAIRSNLPSKRQLASDYKDGKAVISKVSMRYNNANRSRDGVLYETSTGEASLEGEVLTRMTPEGEVQIIGQNLKCSCYHYRQNYNCSHIGLATRDIPKIYQAHSKPKPASMPGVGDAGQNAVRTARSTTYGIANDPETGKNYVNVAMPRRGTPHADSSVILETERIERVSQVDEDDTRRMQRIMAITDITQVSDEDSLFIYQYWQKVQDEERGMRSPATSRVFPLSNQTYLTALADSDVQIPVRVAFTNSERYWSRDEVVGTVRFGAGSTVENPIIVSRSLKCNCAEYRRDYRCKHIDQTEEKYLAAYLKSDEDLRANGLESLQEEESAEPAETLQPVPATDVRAQFVDILNREDDLNWRVRRGASREAAMLEIKEEEERRRAEALERQQKAEREAAVYNDYREMRLAAWQTTDASLADNIDQFKADIEDMRRRKRRGEKVVEFNPDGGVTDGICAPGEGTRSFGVELEFDIKRGVDRQEALQKIAQELHAAGLTKVDYQQRYHASNGTWDSWSFEEDCTVAGEIVSPIMKDTPEHWQQLNQVIDIINRNGGRASTRAGSHVNISSGSLGKSTAKHAELTRIMKQNEDTMFRLASDPGRGSHRGNQWCSPNLDVAGTDIDDKQVGRARSGTSGTHGMMVNYDSSFNSSSLSSARIEYRLWDATLDAGVIQQQVAISAAMTDLAEREVIEKKGYKGRTAEVSETDPDVKAAKLFDRMFRTSAQRKAATQMFAVHNPF